MSVVLGLCHQCRSITLVILLSEWIVQWSFCCVYSHVRVCHVCEDSTIIAAAVS